jgi:hypothetical protein
VMQLEYFNHFIFLDVGLLRLERPEAEWQVQIGQSWVAEEAFCQASLTLFLFIINPVDIINIQ